MGDVIAKQIFAKSIQLADQITKSAHDVQSFKQDCLELKSKTEKLAALLRQAAKASSDLYERPTLQIIDKTEKTLYKSLSLVQKCRCINGLMKLILTITPAKCFSSDLVKGLFTIIIPPTAFKDVLVELEILIGDISWLLGVYVSSRNDRMALGFPSIAQNEPILCLIWEEIDTLCKGLLDDRSDAAASLVSIARDNDRYGKLIVEEGGVGPLLKLVEEGRMEGQENAARAIGLLGRDPQSVQHIIRAGVCDVFEKILNDEGPMEVQSMVAWAVSQLVANHPKCQDHFAQNNIVQLLVSHLAFEYEDPAAKVSMAAKALWYLAKGNSTICRSINESGGLLCFAVLLEKVPDDEVQFNSAMALMEIAAVAEKDTDLRWSAFHPNTPAAKAVFDQLLRIIEQADSDSDLLIPCIMTMGYLARTITATATRIIGLLVKLLEDGERDVQDVQTAAAIALSKFACTGNSSHLKHSKAIISEGGVKHLISLVFFGAHALQISALIVLSYIVLHFPDSEELEQAGVVLEWSSTRDYMIKDPIVETLLPEAKSRLLLYRCRGIKPMVCWTLTLVDAFPHQDISQGMMHATKGKNLTH